MPMIDLTVPEGALSEDALDGLADSLMRALLRSEHVPEDNAARALVSWVHVHELPPGRMYAGGRRIKPGEPFFRIDVSIPADVVDADDKAAFIAEATGLVPEAADREDRGRQRGAGGAGGRHRLISPQGPRPAAARRGPAGGKPGAGGSPGRCRTRRA